MTIQERANILVLSIVAVCIAIILTVIIIVCYKSHHVEPATITINATLKQSIDKDGSIIYKNHDYTCRIN